MIICSTLISLRHLHGPLLKSLSVPFPLAEGLLKRIEKQTSLLSQPSRWCQISSQRKTTEWSRGGLAADWKIIPILQINKTKEGKKNREKHSCFALFACCTCIKERRSGHTSIQSPWPWCPSVFQEDIWPAHTPLLPLLLLHTGLQQLKLAEPVVVMISCS